jgi:hypothetical protein
MPKLEEHNQPPKQDGKQREFRFSKGTHYFMADGLLIGEVYDTDGVAILTEYTKLGSPISETPAKYLDDINFPNITDWYEVKANNFTPLHALASGSNKDVGIVWGIIDTGAGTSSGVRMFITKKAASLLADWQWVPKEK